MKQDTSLVGIGLYTVSEAARLTDIPSRKIIRWLRGHAVRHRAYQPLWTSGVEAFEGALYLSFLDLVQLRVAAAFIAAGLSPQKVRKARQRY